MPHTPTIAQTRLRELLALRCRVRAALNELRGLAPESPMVERGHALTADIDRDIDAELAKGLRL